MAAHPVTHPSADALRAFALGKLHDNAAAVVMNHLDDCPDCCKQVAAVSGDDFLARLRQSRSPSSTSRPAQALSETTGGMKPAPNRPVVANIPPELAANQQYEILRELGRGGMGVVYLAKNKLMDRLEVLKVVNKTLLDHPGAVERFLREIRSAAKLSHANVVGAYHALQMGELLAFAMEYIEGQDLASVVKSKGPLPIVHACYYIQQAAWGLQHAFEKGMVHRDIKPQNLILAREGKKHIVKVLDFGLAKATREKKDDPGLTGEGRMLGTPDYIAPEQTLDAARADIRADIYSLGCTLYYLLSGHPPFSANSLGAILLAHQMQEAKPLNLVRPEVPEELAAMVRRMMAKTPAKRYQTPQEVVQALAPFVKQGTTPKASPELSVGAVEAKPIVKKATPVAPPPLPAAPEAPKKQPQPAVVWESLTEGDIVSIGPRKSAAVRKPQAATVRERPGQKKWLLGGGIGVGVLLLALVGLWAGGMFEGKVQVKTKDGILVIEVNEPNPDVLIDNETVTVSWHNGGKKAEIRVPPGTHKVEVKKDGFSMVGTELTFKDGDREIFTARLLPEKKDKAAKREEKAEAPPPEKSPPPPDTKKPDAPRVAAAAVNDKGFVPLFNGKDLTGWKTYPEKSGKWRVEGGVLSGIGTGVRSPPANLLYSERDDYTDFHLRLVARVSDGCYVIVTGRSPFKLADLPQDHPDPIIGYGVVLNCNNGNANKTGTLRAGRGIILEGSRESPVEANQWFTLDLIVTGNRVVVKVNEQTMADYQDPLRRFARGHIVLHVFDDRPIEFRNIEIKELPATKSETPKELPAAKSETPQATAAATEKKDFVPLFNGKDLTGWKTHPKQPGNWKVVDGAIVSSGPMSHLFSERGDFENFHYRVVAAINDGGNSGQYFRAQFGPGFPRGYEAQIDSTGRDPNKTGSLYGIANVSERLHLPDEWFTQEVIAQGNHIVIKVNDKTVVDVHDSRYKRGHFALQQHNSATVVKFRKIEVMELPAGASPNSAASNLPAEAKEAAKAYEKTCSEARTKLLADFDMALERLEKMKGEAEPRLKLIEAVKEEKKRFEDKGLIPWSEPMRPFLAKYFTSIGTAEAKLRRAYDSLISVQLKAKKQSAIADLQTDLANLIGVRLLARWRHFLNGRPQGINSLYSNGTIHVIINGNAFQGTWTFANGAFIYRWPDPKAPGGFWIDTLKVSADGLRYEGSNQQKVIKLLGEYMR